MNESLSGTVETTLITNLNNVLRLSSNENGHLEQHKRSKLSGCGTNANRCSCVWSSNLLIRNGASEKLTSLPELKIPPLPPSFLSITFDDETTTRQGDAAIVSDTILSKFAYPLQASRVYDAVLIDRQCLSSQNAKKHKFTISLEIKDFEESCEAGDAFSFICPNDALEVDWLLTRLNLTKVADTKCTLGILPQTSKKNANLPTHIPVISTLKHIFTYCLDFRRIFSRSLIRLLSDCCTDYNDERRLTQLSSLEGKEEFEKFVILPNLSLLDILYAFPSCIPPVIRLIELLPRLMPRPLSIASRTIDSDRKYRFIYSLVDISCGEGRFYRRSGICSGYLTQLSYPSVIRMYYRKPSLFRLTRQIITSVDTICVMIGPGTGVAPFLSALGNAEKSVLDECNIKRWLFFGCRESESDFILRNELESYVDSKVLTRFIVSFSRQNETNNSDSSRSRYVQDAIRNHGSDLAPIVLSKKAMIFVCGDAKGMAPEVNKAFIDVLVKHGNVSETEAADFIKSMRMENKYQQDIWS